MLILAATFLSWLMLERFGNTLRVAVAAGTLIRATVFVILWLGLHNMNLATAPVVITALPLAWIEMVVTALIVRWTRAPAPFH